MKPAHRKPGKSKRPKLEYFLLAVQLLALVFFVLGLQFLLNTTGGTLFLFSAVGPGLGMVAIVMLAGAGIYSFRRQHQLFEYETFEAGEVVFEQGEEGDCAYFIEHGEVEVLRNSEGAEPVLVATLTGGHFFGEVALVSNDCRNATIRAKQPTRLAVLGKENFLAMCKLVPSARKDIMQAVQDRVDAKAKKTK